MPISSNMPIPVGNTIKTHRMLHLAAAATYLSYAAYSPAVANPPSHLQKVKLVDAGFIWTEPHSKRLKVKVLIQAEVRGASVAGVMRIAIVGGCTSSVLPRCECNGAPAACRDRLMRCALPGRPCWECKGRVQTSGGLKRPN